MSTSQSSPLSIKCINQWKEWLHIRKFNWCNFAFISVDFELDALSKACELRCFLLGFGMEIRYSYDFEHSEIRQRTDVAYQEILSGGSER